MEALDKPRERFAAIVDTLTEAALADLPDFGTDLLIRTAASQSQNIAELKRGIQAMRSSLPDGTVVSTHDFEALAGFAEANGLPLTDVQKGVTVDEGSGRIISFEYKERSLTDLGALSGLAALKILTLPDCGVLDISPLAGLISLEKLILSRNQIQDISALSNLTLLKVLSMNGNGIQDISALASLTSLIYLNFNENRVQDVSALSGLLLMKRLYLNGNRIQDVSSLAGLNLLEKLSLYGNQVQGISALSGLALLESLELDFNAAQDVSALTGLASLNYLQIKMPQGTAEVTGLENLTAALLEKGARIEGVWPSDDGSPGRWKWIL